MAAETPKGDKPEKKKKPEGAPEGAPKPGSPGAEGPRGGGPPQPKKEGEA